MKNEITDKRMKEMEEMILESARVSYTLEGIKYSKEEWERFGLHKCSSASKAFEKLFNIDLEE